VEEITSTTGKLTPAGLIGNVKVEKGMTRSIPGYLPLASGGVVCIQDFHEITKGRSSIMSILSKVMEDGDVIDSTSARTTHTAITALHVDMNRLSQVYPDKQYNTYSDINIPINLISRFDLIIEIPRDVSRQIGAALDMIAGERTLASTSIRQELPDWQRDLKAIVAYVATYLRSIEVRKEEAAYIDQKLRDIIDNNEKYQKIQRYLSDMMTRLVLSILKFAKAIACSNLRTMVNKSDIDEAFDLILYKLKFLSDFEPIELSAVGDTPDSRQRMILELFQCKEVKTTEILQSQSQYNRKTIDRDLKALEKQGLITKIKQGLWKF